MTLSVVTGDLPHVVCGQCMRIRRRVLFIGKGVGRYTLSEALFTVYGGAGRGGEEGVNKCMGFSISY